MVESRFFPPRAVRLEELCVLTGARAVNLVDQTLGMDGEITGAASLDMAAGSTISFLDNRKYASQLAQTKAAAVFLTEQFVDRLPATVIGLVHPEPYRAYAQALGVLYPGSMRPLPATGETGISPAAHVDPSAQVEDGVIVEAGAVIGPNTGIGRGAHILANAVIGHGVQIGRETTVGCGAVVTHAYVGDRVIIHAGVKIGQDGFGFAMGAGGHKKVPQIGRVIIQDNVEIGANSTIDRGSSRDTVIGEGTKIDNLVQIGHNVSIGRHCVIVGLAGIAGSATLEDFVVVAGQAGIGGHTTIGQGAQVGGGSGTHTDVPAGAKMMGYPAQPFKDWVKMNMKLKQMLSDKGANPGSTSTKK